jgi:hypothetical protein
MAGRVVQTFPTFPHGLSFFSISLGKLASHAYSILYLLLHVPEHDDVLLMVEAVCS